MIPDYRSDIPRSTALAAHSGTSFVPEKRADSVLEEYQATLAKAYSTLSTAAERGSTTDLLEEEFQRFRAGLRKRFLAYYQSRSGIVSTMIAGGSNFPVRRMEKRNQVAHKRLTELIEFEQRATRAACRTLRPDLRPIMTGDSDAIERLSGLISEAKTEQARMKETNTIIRKHLKKPLEQQVAALVSIGYTPAQALRLLTRDAVGRIGYEDFMLTNNGARIRNMEKRLKHLEEMANQPREQIENEDSGITVESNPAENRIRVFFPGKPDALTRSKLKAEGFRWAPSQGAWSGYFSTARLAVAQGIANTPTTTP